MKILTLSEGYLAWISESSTNSPKCSLVYLCSFTAVILLTFFFPPDSTFLTSLDFVGSVLSFLSGHSFAMCPDFLQIKQVPLAKDCFLSPCVCLFLKVDFFEVLEVVEAVFWPVDGFLISCFLLSLNLLDPRKRPMLY